MASSSRTTTSRTSRSPRRIESKKPQPSFTLEELLASLKTLPAQGDPGLSSSEISERLQLSAQQTIRRIRVAVRAGRVAVGRGVRANIVGISMPTPVYRLKK